METLRLDLHNHSRVSPDSRLCIDDMIAQAKARRLDGFALTDHDAISGNAEAISKGEREGLVIIPGCEISSREGHVLALFLERPVKPAPLRTVLHAVRAQDAIAIVSHPLRKGGGVQRQALEANMDLLHGIEVYNPDNTPFGNRSGWRLARRWHKLQTGGSDTHFIQNMGFGVTLVRSEAHTLDAVRAALAAGQAAAAGTHAPPCACPRCRLYYLLEPIGRSRRFQALPASDQALRQANRLLARLFFSAGRAMRW